MKDSVLARLFEHNNWTNMLILEACARLTAAQLDAQPRSVTKGSIRKTLAHLVEAQQSYVQLLTGIAPTLEWDDDDPPALEKLRESLTLSGERFLEVARDELNRVPKDRRRTHDNYLVDAWVPIVQAINHATEHREQISSMLTDLGITPPDMDGWSYAWHLKAIDPANE
jgi:uncharacterized damage-inducible protein DinB